MEGTLTLRGIRQPTVKAPVKRNNTVTIQVHLDGNDYEMSFIVQLSSLMSGQKNKAGLTALFDESLSKTFGRIQRL